MKTNENTAGIIDEDLADRIMETVNLQTESIVTDAIQRGLTLPFQIEHTTEGETLYSVEVVRDEDKLRYLPSDEPWKFKPTNGSKVFVKLTDSEKQIITEKYVLDVQ